VLTILDLFSGIGGFRLALENAGHKVIWSNEILEKPRSIYEHNFKEKPDPRDIRTINPDELPDADLLCGGFPCATFSIAGKRTGFCQTDTRGSLFFEICRILRAKRTKYFILENVKGLLNHDNGRTFGVILASLDELGYDVQWELLNSKNFGVPQNRERIFIVGSLRGKRRPKIFPIGNASQEDDGKNRGEPEERQGFFSNISPTLDANYSKGGASRQYVNEAGVAQWRRGYFREYKSDGTPTLTANMGTGGHNVPFVRAVITPDRAEKRQNGRRFKDDGEPAFTLGAQDKHGVAISDGEKLDIRKLTPMECERLQGFPDNWTKYYADGTLVSDSERYERCGRTITVTVVQSIGERFAKNEYY
jgi:DNA (cytosine-5)-methyltransferase 1|tara:strand:- start:708 stop:1796 length:1089 start_codon:yes stop_codon:yes gene_type:complete